MAEKKNQNNTTEKVMAGVGIAALAAAAAGAVFLYGTDAGKKRRKDIKSWSLRMRADVMDRMEKMKEWDEATYHSIVDAVAEKYNKVKTIDPADVGEMVQDMRKHWKTIKTHVEGPKKKKLPAQKSVKKIAAPKADPKSE